MSKWKHIGVAILGVVAFSTTAQAQNSNVVTLQMSATMQESVSITLTGNANQTWPSLTPGIINASPSGPVNIATSWVLRPGRTQLRLYAFFGAGVALAAQSGDPSAVDIPGSAFLINSANLGTATPVNQINAAVPGVSLILRNTAISAANRNGNSSDDLDFSIDLSSAAMQQLPADLYLGTLSIMAQATP
jgi:hypothetical protein